MGKSLYCICMEQNTMLSCDCSDFLQWLNRTDFIVCCHNRNQNRIRTDSCLQLVQLYFTIFIYIDIGNFISLFLQPLRSMQNRMMLNANRPATTCFFRRRL